MSGRFTNIPSARRGRSMRAAIAALVAVGMLAPSGAMAAMVKPSGAMTVPALEPVPTGVSAVCAVSVARAETNDASSAADGSGVAANAARLGLVGTTARGAHLGLAADGDSASSAPTPSAPAPNAPTPNGTATNGTATTSNKPDEPVVASYLLRDSSLGGWISSSDYSQGEDIPFSVVGALPANLAERAELPYWFVVESDEGLTLTAAAPEVSVLHANGSTDNVTSSLAVTTEGNTIVAGSANIKASVPGLVATDKLVLTYTMRLNEHSRLGLSRGNMSRAHIEYRPAKESAAAAASVAATPASSARSRQSATLHAARWEQSATLHAASQVARGMQATRPLASVLARAGEGAFPTARATALHTAADGDLATREANLTKSEPIQATVYSYELEAHLVATGTNTPLAGARLALQNATGKWYVAGGDWAASVEQATVVTTNAHGNASFRGVGSGTYKLVEVAAPTGYQAADPTDVTITATIADNDGLSATDVSTGARKALATTSREARTVEANATTGLVTATVENDPLTPGTNPNPNDEGGDQARYNNGNGNDNNANSRAGGTTSQRSPKTGDLVYPVGVAVIISVLMLLGGLAIRPRAGHSSTGKSSVGTGRAGQEKGNRDA